MKWIWLNVVNGDWFSSYYKPEEWDTFPLTLQEDIRELLKGYPLKCWKRVQVAFIKDPTKDFLFYPSSNTYIHYGYHDQQIRVPLTPEEVELKRVGEIYYKL